MKRVPPRIVRRAVILPLVVAVEGALVLLAPLLLLLAAAAGAVAGGSRPLRMTAIVLAYSRGHLRALAAMASGAGDPEAGYEVMRRFVGDLYGTIVRIARVDVVVHGSEAAGAALTASSRPVIVLSRHHGEGDTLLVIHELLCRHDRRPRIVMHEALRMDPLFDFLGTRLPNRFVDPRGGDVEHAIADLARDMDGGSAMAIFPEGANFSEERRRRGIQRLLDRGHHREARVAETMRHVIAPRPGGALAAIEAAPDADVVVLGHAGFPTGWGEMWRLLPERQTIELKLWHEPAETIPTGRDERIAWLFERWRLLDEWVRERVAEPDRPG